MSEQGLKILSKRNLLPLLKSVNLSFYEHYVTNKQHRMKSSRSNAKFDLVPYDIQEQPDISLGGTKYLVAFIDDYFKRHWVYRIKKKSYVILTLQEQKAQVELEYKKMIKCLKVDSGTEYTDIEFIVFCKQVTIQSQFMFAYIHQ